METVATGQGTGSNEKVGSCDDNLNHNIIATVDSIYV